MSTRPKLRPMLEVLEDRCVPALTLIFGPGNTLVGITGTPNGDVALTFVNNNRVNVRDNAVDLGTFDTGPNLNVAIDALTAADPDLVVNLGGFQFTGKFALRVGDAPNGWGLTVSNGVIAGSLDVATGNGPDKVLIGEAGPLLVNGPLGVNMGAGNDALTLSNTQVQGPLTVSGANTFNLVATLVTGDLSFDSSAENVGTSLLTDAVSMIQGNALIRTGAGKDSVNLFGTIQGNADLRLKNGNDLVNLNPGATIGGDLSLLLKRGADRTTIKGLIGGDVQADFGEGNDIVTFDGAAVQGFAIVLVVGHGNDVFNVGPAGLAAPQANLVFIGCNGNQTVNWVAALPTLLSAYLDAELGRQPLQCAAQHPVSSHAGRVQLRSQGRTHLASEQRVPCWRVPCFRGLSRRKLPVTRRLGRESMRAGWDTAWSVETSA